MNLSKTSFKINVNVKELNINYLFYDDDKGNKLYNFDEEENDEYESEKSEESEESGESRESEESGESEESDDKLTFTKEQIDMANRNTIKNENKDYEFKKDFNEFNYLVINDSQQSIKYPCSKSDKNDNNLNNCESSNIDFSISEEIQEINKKESTNEKIDLKFYKFKPYTIDKTIYKELLDGNQKLYNWLIKDIEEKKNNTFNIKSTILLKKKRNKNFSD